MNYILEKNLTPRDSFRDLKELVHVGVCCSDAIYNGLSVFRIQVRGSDSPGCVTGLEVEAERLGFGILITGI
jgi:hypothetical protein